jgi:hypothetical protein
MDCGSLLCPLPEASLLARSLRSRLPQSKNHKQDVASTATCGTAAALTGCNRDRGKGHAHASNQFRAFTA